ncbi:MAG: Fe-S cluster assembly protein NifU [Deltaproteobacteria bacterium]|nr:Fe-S cluster assembly protein NifU [Deltaproteobacteria bacterium]
MWDYTEKVKDHFLHPRNVGEMKDPDGVGEVGSLACGGALKFMFKLDKNKKIKEAKFQTFGCGSAIASASVLTEMVVGKTLDEAEKITNRDIAEELGGLPEEKMHCSVMGREALEAAIANNRGIDIKKELEGEVICKCFGITDKEIERVIKDNQLSSVADVTHYTKAGGGCETCHPKIEEILLSLKGEVKKEPVEAKPPPKRKLTNIQRMKLIEETIEREIRPALQADGGDIDLVDIEGYKVIVTLRGTCSSCPSSDFTLKGFAQGKLREFVSDDIEVVVES